MSRFVNLSATERVPLGPCQCPDARHGEDWIELRTEIAGPEWYVIAQGVMPTLGLLVTAWSLEDDDGPVPVDDAHLAALDLPTFRLIDVWINDHIKVPTLPNASGAPSPTGSRGRNSRTRTTRTRR